MNNVEILENLIKSCHDEKDILYKLDKETKKALENILKENKKMKEEKVLNEKILFFANNTLCNYHEGYQAGLHKEITATEIVAEERERFIIGQEIKRLKEENLELHKEINQRIKLKLENERCADKDFIPKSKIKEKIEELEEQLKYNLFKNHEIYTVVENKLLHKIEVLQELLEK